MKLFKRAFYFITLMLLPVLALAAGSDKIVENLDLARQHLLLAQQLCDEGSSITDGNRAADEMKLAIDLLDQLAPAMPSHRLENLTQVIEKARFCLIAEQNRSSAIAYLHGPISTLESFIKEFAHVSEMFAEPELNFSIRESAQNVSRGWKDWFKAPPKTELDEKYEMVDKQPNVAHTDSRTGKEFTADGKSWKVGKFNINWSETQTWIKQLGEGWRAPTYEELRSMFKAMGGKPHYYKISSSLPGIPYLGTDTAWAQERKENCAWYFECYTASKHWLKKDKRSIDMRAVAVRDL